MISSSFSAAQRSSKRRRCRRPLLAAGSRLRVGLSAVVDRSTEQRALTAAKRRQRSTLAAAVSAPPAVKVGGIKRRWCPSDRPSVCVMPLAQKRCVLCLIREKTVEFRSRWRRRRLTSSASRKLGEIFTVTTERE